MGLGILAAAVGDDALAPLEDAADAKLVLLDFFLEDLIFFYSPQIWTVLTSHVLHLAITKPRSLPYFHFLYTCLKGASFHIIIVVSPKLRPCVGHHMCCASTGKGSVSLKGGGGAGGWRQRIKEKTDNENIAVAWWISCVWMRPQRRTQPAS
uniref:Uncharacterized protein n=1 Tax=Myotis myotis TaxID=51298 RepID=A0A7J8ALV1_MYOMY|nr:hypothetical protein mMyoMyo1_008005 [Myotis myotis]